jgi:Raf kinase inhibitor-like YbhB/YbcL family protein
MVTPANLAQPQQRRAPLPYEFLPALPSFALTSTDIADGQMLGLPYRYDGFGAGGANRSPHLAWSGFPAQALSFAITCFDPDAPTGSGFWHWVLFDLPAEVTELTTGAGSAAGGAGEAPAGLPAGAVHARNDFGACGYGGPAPQPGWPPHRYLFSVHALGVARLGLGADASPAMVGFNLAQQAIARATFMPLCGP